MVHIDMKYSMGYQLKRMQGHIILYENTVSFAYIVALTYSEFHWLIIWMCSFFFVCLFSVFLLLCFSIDGSGEPSHAGY